MKSRKTLRDLPVLYNKEEMLNFSEKSMECLLEIDRINNLKKQLTPLQDEAIDISKKMKQGFEERPVNCIIEYNQPHNGKKTIIREDTGETVAIENMTGEELQEDMEFKEETIVQDAKQLTSGYELAPQIEDVTDEKE